MTELLSPEQVDELEALADKATDGPWAWDSRGDKCVDVQVGKAINNEDEPLTGFISESDDAIYVESIAEITSQAPHADADFIASSRQAVPALICTIRQVWLERDNTVAEAAQLRDFVEHAFCPDVGKAKQILASTQLAAAHLDGDRERDADIARLSAERDQLRAEGVVLREALQTELNWLSTMLADAPDTLMTRCQSLRDTLSNTPLAAEQAERVRRLEHIAELARANVKWAEREQYHQSRSEFQELAEALDALGQEG